MFRPLKLFAIGSALIGSIILAWTGAGRTQTRDPQHRDMLAEMRQREELLATELQMLRAELADLKGQLQKQSAVNQKLAGKLTDLEKRVEVADLIAAALKVRNETLLVSLKDKAKNDAALSERDSASQNEKRDSAGPPNEPFRGRVTSIDSSDGTLIEINVGKNANLEKHLTLEVFHPGDHPEYVGSLRVFEVYGQRAVCRLVSYNPLKKTAVKVGDAVAAACAGRP